MDLVLSKRPFSSAAGVGVCLPGVSSRQTLETDPVTSYCTLEDNIIVAEFAGQYKLRLRGNA